MDEKIRREEMSDIDAMNAMEEIDRISTGEGADELNGVWSSAGPRGIADGVMNSMDQIPPDKLRLPTFSWIDYVRPLNKEDIFYWRGKREGEMLKPTTDRRPKTNKRNLINMK